MERKKTDKEKSHNKGIWRSDASEASQGQTRDVPGTHGTFGPDFESHGTDGTCPRDRRDAHRGVSRQNFMFIGFFLSPWIQGVRETYDTELASFASFPGPPFLSWKNKGQPPKGHREDVKF